MFFIAMLVLQQSSFMKSTSQSANVCASCVTPTRPTTADGQFAALSLSLAPSLAHLKFVTPAALEAAARTVVGAHVHRCVCVCVCV